MSEKKIIPVAEPSIGERELKYVTDCVKSGWISSIGRYVNQFQTDFATYCDCQYGVATHNGTVALHLLAMTLNMGPGDEVIMPSLTYVATANAMAYTGATPVFVDSDLATWNIDPSQVEAAITPNTKAIIAVHLYGHPADMDPLRQIADKHGLYLFEDAAEAHGARYKGKIVGSLSDAAVFSFYGNKIITTGEGGMLVTDNKEWADRAYFLENQGRYSSDPYWHPEVGYNYRMTNLQAAVGVGQLERIDELLAIRRKNAEHYTRRLQGVPGLTMPPEAEWAENVFWMYSVIVGDDFPVQRDDLRKVLREEGIDSRPFFYPLHILPMYKSEQNLPNAEYLGSHGLNLPSGSTLTSTQVDKICDTLIAIVER